MKFRVLGLGLGRMGLWLGVGLSGFRVYLNPTVCKIIACGLSLGILGYYFTSFWGPGTCKRVTVLHGFEDAG